MNEKNEPQRGLEKVSHFFLTGETAANQDPESSVDNSVTNQTAHAPNSSVHQNTDEYDRLENTVAQLYVLRDSCKGMYYTRNPDNEIIWFKGAASILQDAIANLIKTLSFIENNNSPELK
jgi:hypothetical protein